MPQVLKTIAVDLTPVLRGGENGGAKIFVLELLRRLARLAPQTQFVLLTHARSHEELAVLDSANVRRHLVVGLPAINSLRRCFAGLAAKTLSSLPRRFLRPVSRFAYHLNAALRRNSSGALLRDMGADLLFCPFTAPTYSTPGIPTVCTIYDLQYKTYPEFFSAAELAYRERSVTEACSRATMLVAISDYARDSVIAHCNLDRARIQTIYLRMAQRALHETDCHISVLSRLGLTSQRYILYPANFWKHKNHEMLFTAFGIACCDGLAPDIKLVCTGAPGARQDWLRSAAKAMDMGDRVLFPGFLPTEELAALMANCSGTVFPSLYEGFGLPVIEAMAMGVPVACSNTTSLPEIVANAAVLFDPCVSIDIAQAIIAIVEDKNLRLTLVDAGRQRAAEFSDANLMAKEYWEAFSQARAWENRDAP